MKRVIIFLALSVILSSFVYAGISLDRTKYYFDGTNYATDNLENGSEIGFNGSAIVNSSSLTTTGWTLDATARYSNSGRVYRGTYAIETTSTVTGTMELTNNASFVGVSKVYWYDDGTAASGNYKFAWLVLGTNAQQIAVGMQKPTSSTVYVYATSAWAVCDNNTIARSVGWKEFMINVTSTIEYIYINGTLCHQQDWITGLDNVHFYTDDSSKQYIDAVSVWSGSNEPQDTNDTTPPSISNLNCTSCNIPYGDTTSPYETEDTTPTFRFTTNENAWCAIGKNDINYTTMGASRNCTSGEGAQSHICTLTIQDRFTNVGANYLYISCKDSSNNEGNVSNHSKSNSGPIKMEIQGASETNGDTAIQLGITASEIGATATIYTTQRISARNLATNQFTGIFDKVAVNGNKRWAFNYVSSGESQITGLFNLTPVLYVLQLQNQTNETITYQVGKLINNTWP